MTRSVNNIIRFEHTNRMLKLCRGTKDCTDNSYLRKMANCVVRKNLVNLNLGDVSSYLRPEQCDTCGVTRSTTDLVLECDCNTKRRAYRTINSIISFEHKIRMLKLRRGIRDWADNSYLRKITNSVERKNLVNLNLGDASTYLRPEQCDTCGVLWAHTLH